MYDFSQESVALNLSRTQLSQMMGQRRSNSSIDDDDEDVANEKKE